MSKTFNILVLCTGNSARSILGEALFNHLGAGRVKAWSAGSQPAGAVHPGALETLAKHGIAAGGARSKSWDEFTVAGPRSGIPGTQSESAPTFDFIFTVCAKAAAETCPVWPGHPASAHWGIPDPAYVEPAAARREAFEAAYRSLEKRIRAFLALPLESMTAQESALAARQIHHGA